MQLPREQRRVVFYSEGPVYWTHLGGLLQTYLETSEETVCFFSSSKDDPGLELCHQNLKTFLIDEGWVRDWLFENIETDLMVMTTPDLHNYQLRRSKHSVHYVYVQHSLISLHMGYRPGAFDHFDTIFCAGPHHVSEVRALERHGNTQPKNIVEHGYGRLDQILAEPIDAAGQATDSPRVLIAPSWGPTGVIEMLGVAPVDALLDAGCDVTLRPHPQTVRHSLESVNAILAEHEDNPKFHFDDNMSSTESLQNSDVMLSDWSGAALDYAFGLGKPVVFVDTPPKTNNPNYGDISIDPIESSIRNIIGEIVGPTDLDSLGSIVKRVIGQSDRGSLRDTADQHVFNLSKSDAVGAAALQEILRGVTS